MVQQRPTHPQALLSLSLRSCAPGHHIYWHSGLGHDGQRHQVVDLGHYPP
jgi:hypothetical protein